MEASLASQVASSYKDQDYGSEAPDPDDREDPFDTDETSEDDDLMPERLIENGQQNLSQKEVSDLIAQELAQQEKESTDLINEELKRSGNSQIDLQ